MPVLLPLAHHKRFRSPSASMSVRTCQKPGSRLLARVLTELKEASQKADGKAHTPEETAVSVQEWRPTPAGQVERTIAIRRAERDARYQQAVSLHEQGRSIKEIAGQLRVSERTVRHWFERGVAPDTRPRRKRQSDAGPLRALVLKRWQDGEHNGTRIFEEIAAASALQAHSAWSTAS